MTTIKFNPLAAEVFFATFQGHGDHFVTYLHLVRSLSMFTVWHRLFSLVLKFPGLRIEAPPP